MKLKKVLGIGRKKDLEYLQKLNIKDRVIEYKIKKNLEKLKRN